MRIEFTCSRPPEYFRGAWRPAARRAARGRLVAAVVVTVVGVVAGLLVGGTPGAVLAGTAVLVAAGQGWVARRRYLAALVVPAAYSTPRHYLVTDAGLATDTELTSSFWSWDVVRWVVTRPESFLFGQEGPAIFDLPREPMSPAEDAELLAWVAALPPRPRRTLPAGVRRH